MTLERDDVDLAEDLLRHPGRWNDDGPVEEFEKEFARWNGSRYARSFMGGRVALSACIEALGLKSGDEVIVPGYTCVVVPNAFKFAAIKVAYADIELETYGLDANSVRNAITKQTKAIVIQHLYGLVSRDYEVLVGLARKHGLWIIEDCAQSTGAKFMGHNVGNMGDMAIYSSEQSKILCTIQGGVATTNNSVLATRLAQVASMAPIPAGDWIRRQLRQVRINYETCKHSQRWWREDWMRLRYLGQQLVSTTEAEQQGKMPNTYGCRMPGAIARLGINQLRKVHGFNELRRQGGQHWDAWCQENGHVKPRVQRGSEPVFLRYPVLVKQEMKADLSWSRRLSARPGIWFVSNLHPARGELAECPCANMAVRCCINFPTIL